MDGSHNLYFIGFAACVLYFLQRRHQRTGHIEDSTASFTKCNLSNQQIRRYGRQLILKGFGCKSQEALDTKAVLVVGAGGIGSTGTPPLRCGRITIYTLF